jgi:6-phospho-beta-glucosidase
VGALTVAGRTVEPPETGGRRDAWLSRWTSDGTLQWVDAWGGPGDDLAKGVVEPVARYERYLTERSAGYMQLESGGEGAPQPPAPWAHLTGYDKIALNTIQAMVRHSNAVIPLNVVNRGNIPELADDDVIEVPSVVNANGPHALHVGTLPPQVRDLVVQVKTFERATIDGVRTGTREALVAALALNPLVPTHAAAARLVEALSI